MPTKTTLSSEVRYAIDNPRHFLNQINLNPDEEPAASEETLEIVRKEIRRIAAIRTKLDDAEKKILKRLK